MCTEASSPGSRDTHEGEVLLRIFHVPPTPQDILGWEPIEHETRLVLSLFTQFADVRTSTLVPLYLGDAELLPDANVVALLDLRHLNPDPSFEAQKAAHGMGYPVPINHRAAEQLLCVKG